MNEQKHETSFQQKSRYSAMGCIILLAVVALCSIIFSVMTSI